MRSTLRNPSPQRFKVFSCLLIGFVLVVLGKYGYLMLGSRVARTSAEREQMAGRGPILDRNGRILAMETRLGNISVWKPDIPEPKERVELAEKLAPILEIKPEDILARIENSPGDFLYLKKQADEMVVKLVEKVQREDKLPGIGIEAVVGRVYPEGNLASQIIGFVGDDRTGLVPLGGIEYAFEEDLRPTANSPGNRLYLTLDANVQHILENIGEKVLQTNKAEAVMLLAMDPRTGDILGSASLPNFDPNRVRDSTEIERMDRPAIWSYEPGSVFKIFSLSVLLDTEAINERSLFYCDGRYEHITNRGERIVINCLGAHGDVNSRGIIIYSCNAGAGYASDRLGAKFFYDGLKAFGFGAKTGVGVRGETAGFFRSSDKWSERSKPTIAMGQEIAVSALQMIQAASAVANDGILVPPRLISKIVSPDGKTVKEYSPGESRRVIRADIARTMRSYMTDVTTSQGTGWRANMDDISLAVKTGTAQITDPRTGAYSDTDFIASCIALLPAESPSLVLYLVIVRPQGASYLGGQIAAPPIREAAEELINYLGIPRGRNPQVNHPGSIILPVIPEPQLSGTIPNFRGLPKRSLLPLLLRDDIKVEITGDGWVIRQSPAPGSPITKDTVIRLELE